MIGERCAFGDELGPCEAPAAWILTAGGIKHPVCGRHRDAAEDRLTDLELGRVLAEPVLPADGEERWHWCDPILLRAFGAEMLDTATLSAPARRVLGRIRRGEPLSAEDEKRLARVERAPG